MIKIRQIVILSIISILIYSCGGNSTTPFDHEAQSIIDKDSITEFLKNNYYDSTLDSIKPLKSGKIALIDDANLNSQDISFNDINYKLYYYVNRVGTPVPDKGSPTSMDSVFVNYNGQSIVNKDSLGGSFDKRDQVWQNLAGVIPGWYYGFQHFKGGENITNNGPITYQNFGKGILIIPSGLAYRDQTRPGILANSNLVFYIELLDIVKDTDHDNDGVPSIYEEDVATNDGNPRNDDTDGDQVPNYLDNDDDGDGVLTKDEDANGDGDPRNDDTDGDGIPDYLDPDTK